MKNSLLILCTLLGLIITGCNSLQNNAQSPKSENSPGDEIYSSPIPSSSPKSVMQGTNYENKKVAWGLKKIKNSPPQVPTEWKELLKRFDGYYIGDEFKKNLYLTFDEGYENGYTAQILDILKETATPAAFFVTGPYLDKETDLIKRMVNEGHIVGNHTINHPSMPEVKDDEKLKAELTALDEKFFKLTGKKMEYLRPPKGEFSERTLAISKSIGYKTILWSSAYEDWDTNKQRGTDYAINQVTNYFHNGNIILLHAVSKDNANALSSIIKIAKEQGYTFESLEKL